MWRLQRRYYEEEGIEAWRSGEVPHYVTSNPVVGKTYAELVLAYLRDLSLKGQQHEKVYLIELGAGHGRLCYHFFQHFEKYYQGSGIELPPFCFVLSDFAQANLDFWKGQDQLQRYVEKGWLDICLFDAEKSTSLVLQYAETTIAAGSLQQPLIVIANYFFDSIPQDLFLIGDGVLSSGHLSLHTQERNDAQETAELIEDLQFEFSYELESFPMYKTEPLQDMILEDYVAQLTASHLLFPHIGICCLDRLKALSTQGLFVITADKGEQHVHHLDSQEEPIPVTHGSLSLLVNYHAFIEYTKLLGGEALFPTEQVRSLLLGCLFLGSDKGFNETKQAYRRYVTDYGPDDFFSVKKLVENKLEEQNAADILAIIRWSGYDARMFTLMLPRLFDLADELSDRERHNLFVSVPKIWETYFHLGEDHDLAFDLGDLLLELVYYQEAVLYFERSLDRYDSEPQILYKIAVCHCMSGAFKLAKPYLSELQEIDDENASLIALIDKFEVELA